MAVGLSYATLGPAEGRRARAKRRAERRELGLVSVRCLNATSSSVAAGASTEPCDLLCQPRPHFTFSQVRRFLRRAGASGRLLWTGGRAWGGAIAPISVFSEVPRAPRRAGAIALENPFKK